MPCHALALHSTAAAQESELTPTGANLLDGRYAVFGYVTEGSSLLKEMQVGA
jgi:cyclophilin family peptidyl-prolyl cis-trans isomerase